jgi:hypothetical protein
VSSIDRKGGVLRCCVCVWMGSHRTRVRNWQAARSSILTLRSTSQPKLLADRCVQKKIARAGAMNRSPKVR